MSVAEKLRGLGRSFFEMDTVDVVTRLSLVAILVSEHVAGYEWYIKTPVRGLAFLGIMLPPIHRKPGFWLTLAVIFAFRSISDWWIQDNHLFLFSYWTLALCLALRLPDPDAALRTSARLMIGFSFAFATLWKGFLSPDYMDGSYFHFTVLGDPRFYDLGAIVGRVSPGAQSTNIELMGMLGRWRPDVPAVTLQSTPFLALLAQFLTWWTVVIEGMLGLCFLWPGRRGPARIRNWVLLLFGLTTYTVATVPTFGWVLMTFGAAQCEKDERGMRLAYTLACGLILIYSYLKILTLLRPLVPEAG